MIITRATHVMHLRNAPGATTTAAMDTLCLAPGILARSVRADAGFRVPALYKAWYGAGGRRGGVLYCDPMSPHYGTLFGFTHVGGRRAGDALFFEVVWDTGEPGDIQWGVVDDEGAAVSTLVAQRRSYLFLDLDADLVDGRTVGDVLNVPYVPYVRVAQGAPVVAQKRNARPRGSRGSYA